MRLTLIFVLSLLAGCVGERAMQVYSKPEVDAIAARTQCRAQARTLVQIARCNDL